MTSAPGGGSGVSAQTPDYCREIESYLCRKNDGHLIRVVGPAFERVARWAAEGIPLKIAFRGIDRYFERYYRTPARRRPVRIEFCEADVLDVFDDWRRALGLTATAGPAARADDPAAPSGGEVPEGSDRSRRPSLPDHLERAVRRLTNARALGVLGPEAEVLIDRVSGELDAARGASRGLRGEPRRQLIARLADLDEELGRIARGCLTEAERGVLDEEAEQELSGYRASMHDDAYRRARDAAADRLARERFGLPTLTFS